MLKNKILLSLIVAYALTAFAETNPLPSNAFFTVNGVTISSPVNRMGLEQFLQQSVLYTPKDVVHDGLPWYGTARDDWMPKTQIRKHTGIDIYADSMVVVAAADGEVSAIGRGENSGGNITISHANGVETMYVHLTKLTTFEGATVNAGDIIGVITKPEGNAYETQLHWVLRVNGGYVDPVKFIRKEQGSNPKIRTLLDNFERGKAERVRARDTLVAKSSQKK